MTLGPIYILKSYGNYIDTIPRLKNIGVSDRASFCAKKKRICTRMPTCRRSRKREGVKNDEDKNTKIEKKKSLSRYWLLLLLAARLGIMIRFKYKLSYFFKIILNKHWKISWGYLYYYTIPVCITCRINLGDITLGRQTNGQRNILELRVNKVYILFIIYTM